MTVTVLESDLQICETPGEQFEPDQERPLKLLIVEILRERGLVSGSNYHELRINLFGKDSKITHARFKRAVNDMVYGSRRHSPDLRVDMVVTRDYGGLCDRPSKTYNLLPKA